METTIMGYNRGYNRVYSRVIWVVVKIMVPFWIPILIRHLIFRVPQKKDHHFDNHPYVGYIRQWEEGSLLMTPQSGAGARSS